MVIQKTLSLVESKWHHVGGAPGQDNNKGFTTLQELQITGLDITTYEDLYRTKLEVQTWIPRRHLVTVYSLTAAGLMLILRYNLSIAIVTMDLDWDASMQGNVLGAYFITFMIFNPIGGALAERFGGRWVMFVGSTIPAMLTFLSPVVVRWSSPAFIVLRVIMGAFHALVLPAGYSLVAHWIPVHEKTFAVGCLQGGTYAGAFVAFLMTGYICDNPSLGWEGSFYISGILAIVWAVGFLYLIYDTPDEHPRISPQELAYLKQYNGNATMAKKPTVKLTAVFCSRAVWASIVAKFSWGFGTYIMVTKLPAYMDEVFNVAISVNGIYNAVPYAAFAISGLASSRLAEYIHNQRYLSLVNTRRVFASVSMVGPAVCILLIPAVGSKHEIVELLLIISQTLSAFCCGGDCPNVADYSGPNFTGLIFGITNSMSGLDGLIAPIIVGAVLEVFPAGQQWIAWNYIFYLTGGIYLVGTLLFCLLVSSDLQEWAVVKDKTQTPDVAPELSHVQVVTTCD